MWAASLKVAVYIASFVIQVPTISTLYKSCHGAVGVIQNEKAMYTSCVTVQLNQCDVHLAKSIVSEIQMYNVSRNFNQELLQQVQALALESMANYTTLRDSLDAWANLNSAKQPIPFIGGVEDTKTNTSTNTNSTCSPEQRDAILNAVGDVTALTSEVMLLSEGYSATSQNSIQRLGTYAKHRMAYDEAYLNNHTQDMQHIIHAYIESLEMQLPQLNVGELVSNLFNDVDGLVPCISSSDDVNQHGVCQFVKGAPQHLAEVWQDYYDMIDLYYEASVNYHLLAIQYMENVHDAFEITAAFYNGTCTNFQMR
jgi:hypothetical protein